MVTTTLDEDLRLLEVKLKQLKLDYEQYFCGARPREPAMARGEIQKQMLILTQTPIKNTAARFKFNSIQSRFISFKRQWDNINRQIENGTYERHVFKANLKSRVEPSKQATPASSGKPGNAGGDLFESYRDAAASCGQDVKNLTPERLQGVIARQEKALKEKLGCEKVNFRVVVQEGKVKLKASPVR